MLRIRVFLTRIQTALHAHMSIQDILPIARNPICGVTFCFWTIHLEQSVPLRGLGR